MGGITLSTFNDAYDIGQLELSDYGVFNSPMDTTFITSIETVEMTSSDQLRERAKLCAKTQHAIYCSSLDYDAMSPMAQLMFDRIPELEAEQRNIDLELQKRRNMRASHRRELFLRQWIGHDMMPDLMNNNLLRLIRRTAQDWSKRRKQRASQPKPRSEPSRPPLAKAATGSSEERITDKEHSFARSRSWSDDVISTISRAKR